VLATGAAWRQRGQLAAAAGLGIGSGAAVGFVVGVADGLVAPRHYWIHPVLRVLGPIPTTALLPISFYFFLQLARPRCS
jgi:NitT/TauT family transport system permease protein